MSNIRKKKILYIITKSNWGGAQRYVFDLAAHFSEKYDAAVALGGDGSLKKYLEEAGIRTIQVKGLGRDVGMNEIFVFFRLLSIIKKERPDILHLNSSKIGAMGALAGRIAGVPRIVFTAHGWAFREERSTLSTLAIKALSWATILLSHKVITVSERDERDARPMPFASKKLVTIHNGVEESDRDDRNTAREKIFKRSGFPERERLSILHDAMWIGTIGELHKNKGHLYAIEAFATIPKTTNAIFVVIGEGEERLALEQKIAELGLKEKVALIGRRSDAAALLPAFDVFLFPSIKEGLPYAVLEAGLSGLSVIAAGVGGIPEIIEDMKSGILVRPRDPGEIAKAFDFLFTHPEKIKRFGKDLRAFVKKNFSLASMFRKTEEAYEAKKKS